MKNWNEPIEKHQKPMPTDYQYHDEQLQYLILGQQELSVVCHNEK